MTSGGRRVKMNEGARMSAGERLQLSHPADSLSPSLAAAAVALLLHTLLRTSSGCFSDHLAVLFAPSSPLLASCAFLAFNPDQRCTRISRLVWEAVS